MTIFCGTKKEDTLKNVVKKQKQKNKTEIFLKIYDFKFHRRK